MKKLLYKFKELLFTIFLKNKKINETTFKNSFLRVLFISIFVILFCMLLSYPLNMKLNWGFQEGRPVTWLSFCLLNLVGFISYEIFKIRNNAEPNNKSVKMWFYLSIIFVYLGFDDLLRFHEEIDHLICKIFGWDKHGPADKIDDLLIVLYGIIAVGVLLKNIKESLKFKNGIFYFGSAIIFAIISTICDLFGGMAGPLSSIFSQEKLPHVLQILDIIEETCKTMAGTFFVGAFLNIYHKLK